ncbi:glycosyltransferase [Scytonema sp. NUACC21]
MSIGVNEVNNNPLVSIIVPAYNAERTILDTIQSVQQQTFSNFEIIVINDGSTDNTLELLKSVCDERLKVFSYKNGGISTARNYGISHARGEFIAFLDADDLWTTDKLELQLAALQKHPKAGVAYSWTYFWHEKKSVYEGKPIFFQGNVQANLLVDDFISSGSNTLIRRQAIESTGEFDPTLISCADWDYWIRLAVNWDFVVVPKHQVYYRVSPNSISSNIEVVEKSAMAVVEKAFENAPTNLRYLKNQSLARVYQYCTQKYLQRKENSFDAVNQAAKRLSIAIYLHPPILLQKYTHTLLKWLLKKWVLVLTAKSVSFSN